MTQTDIMIQSFENILDDSIIKGISIFRNPNTRKFIKQYQQELSMPNAFKDISNCVDKNRNEYENRMGEIPSQLDFDMETLILAYSVLAYAGEAEFEQCKLLI